jgi:heme A synthase
MNRSRNILGVAAAVLIIASSGMHAFIGWPSVLSGLRTTNSPPDMIQGLGLNWILAAVFMWTLGLIALKTFADRLRARPAVLWPTALMSAVYVLFGIGAIVVSKNPFFLIFIVPGVMLAGASWGIKES